MPEFIKRMTNHKSTLQGKSKRVLILGGGFAGIEVLKRLQSNGWRRSKSKIDITLVSEDNFVLFTPLLPEVATGMIETRHITTPIRTFCKKAKFYEASVDSIDLAKKEVHVSHLVGSCIHPTYRDQHILGYDYLVIATGNESNFFGIPGVEQYALKMKTIDDAISLRNHVISILEQAHLEQHNKELRKKLLTFVVVGGGFSGIETVGVLNDFLKDTVKEFYMSIAHNEINIILINAQGKVLPEVTQELGDFALKKLKDKGIQFIMNHRVTRATPNEVILDDDRMIPTFTLIWTAGVTSYVREIIVPFQCSYGQGGRIVTNGQLQVKDYDEVYAVGDCALIVNPYTGNYYQPTAQNAIEEGKLVAKNIICSIEDNKHASKNGFQYKNKGMMAQIGRRTGVAQIFGFKFHGIIAWWLWRTYYLVNLPTLDKKLKVMSDWSLDFLFKPDIAMIKRTVTKYDKEQSTKDKQLGSSTIDKNKNMPKNIRSEISQDSLN